MKRDSFGDILNKPMTPLKPIGQDGTPARIVEIPENVTAFESKINFINSFIIKKFKINSY